MYSFYFTNRGISASEENGQWLSPLCLFMIRSHWCLRARESPRYQKCLCIYTAKVRVHEWENWVKSASWQFLDVRWEEQNMDTNPECHLTIGVFILKPDKKLQLHAHILTVSTLVALWRAGRPEKLLGMIKISLILQTDPLHYTIPTSTGNTKWHH